MKYYVYIIVLLILLFIFICTSYFLRLKNYESFVGLSTYNNENIIDNCLNEGWGKQNNSNDCVNNAYVTNPRYLCGLCGDDNNQLYSIKNNGTNLYGCKKYNPNSYGLNWLKSQENLSSDDTLAYPLNRFLSDVQTCNSMNMNSISNMYLYVCTDDYCNIQINNTNINQTGWNTLGVYLIENVKYEDILTITSTNVCGPGGLCLSYIWNKQLYILDNNGFESCAHIINYQLDNIDDIDGLSNIWASGNYVPNLLPWMKNWINIKATNQCIDSPSNNTSIKFTCKIGDTQKTELLTNDLTVFLGIDDTGTVLLNNKNIYNKSEPWNNAVQFTVPNVNENDVLTINCVNGGGPGGIGLSYLWCGRLFSFKSTLNNFNSVINLMKYTSTNCNSLSYDPSGVNGNLQFVTQWLNSCTGNCNFSVTTKIGDTGPPSWVYGQSMNKWYTIVQNNFVSKWGNIGINSSLNMTITFLLNLTTINPQWRNIFHLSNQNNDCCNIGNRVPALWIWPSQNAFYLENDTVVQADRNTSAYNIPMNTPSFITLTFNGLNVSIYINGVLQTTNVYDQQLMQANNDAYFYIGDPWYIADGGISIKNFTIYNSVMSQQQITNMYQSNMGPN